MNNIHVIRYLIEISKDNIVYPCTLRRVIRDVQYVCGEKSSVECKYCNCVDEFNERKWYV